MNETPCEYVQRFESGTAAQRCKCRAEYRVHIAGSRSYLMCARHLLEVWCTARAERAEGLSNADSSGRNGNRRPPAGVFLN